MKQGFERTISKNNCRSEIDQPVKNIQESYVEMSQNDNYTLGNLLHFLYHQNYCKLIGIDLSRQENTTIPQQSNFTEKLNKDDDVTMFYYH